MELRRLQRCLSSTGIAMHILLVALAISCLLRPGLALVGRDHNTHQQNGSHRCRSNSRRSSSSRKISAFAASTTPTSFTPRHQSLNCRIKSNPSIQCRCHSLGAFSLDSHTELVRRNLRRIPRAINSVARSSSYCSCRHASMNADDDSNINRKRIEPSAARAFPRAHGGEDASGSDTSSGPGRGVRGGRGRAAGGRGRPRAGNVGGGNEVASGSTTGRLRRATESGSSRSASVSSSSTRETFTDRDTEQPRKSGIDQDDPLVKSWNSAKVLDPRRDEFPLGGRRSGRSDTPDEDRGRGRAGRGYMQGQNRDRFVGRAKSFVKPDDERRRSRQGTRGRREETNAMRIGMYRSGDSVPWYIKEVQEKGLDTEGKFKAWWRNNLDLDEMMRKVSNMKVSELKELLKEMGMSVSGVKAELVDRAQQGLHQFSLADDNFRSAQVGDTWSQDSDLPACFPQARCPVELETEPGTTRFRCFFKLHPRLSLRTYCICNADRVTFNKRQRTATYYGPLGNYYGSTRNSPPLSRVGHEQVSFADALRRFPAENGGTTPVKSDIVYEQLSEGELLDLWRKLAQERRRRKGQNGSET